MSIYPPPPPDPTDPPAGYGGWRPRPGGPASGRASVPGSPAGGPAPITPPPYAPEPTSGSGYVDPDYEDPAYEDPDYRSNRRSYYDDSGDISGGNSQPVSGPPLPVEPEKRLQDKTSNKIVRRSILAGVLGTTLLGGLIGWVRGGGKPAPPIAPPAQTPSAAAPSTPASTAPPPPKAPNNVYDMTNPQSQKFNDLQMMDYQGNAPLEEKGVVKITGAANRGTSRVSYQTGFAAGASESGDTCIAVADVQWLNNYHGDTVHEGAVPHGTIRIVGANNSFDLDLQGTADGRGVFVSGYEQGRVAWGGTSFHWEKDPEDGLRASTHTRESVKSTFSDAIEDRAVTPRFTVNVYEYKEQVNWGPDERYMFIEIANANGTPQMGFTLKGMGEFSGLEFGVSDGVRQVKEGKKFVDKPIKAGMLLHDLTVSSDSPEGIGKMLAKDNADGNASLKRAQIAHNAAQARYVGRGAELDLDSTGFDSLK